METKQKAMNVFIHVVLIIMSFVMLVIILKFSFHCVRV